MGATLCKNTATPNKVSQDSIEDTLIKALKVKGARHKQKIKHINTLLLKFPVMIQKLEELKVYFHEADKGKSGVITPDEFLLFCQELKVPLSKETTQKLFDMTDFNKDKEMEFQEFVVVCALVYLLEENTKSNTLQVFADIYDLVIDAFLYFDKNNSGFLDRDEVREGFSEGATPAVKNKGQAAGGFSARFEEMDWDKNGKVSFREFLFALEKWIGMEDEDKGADTYFSETRPSET